MLPDFIIIGAMKCGTGSLYKYLATDPKMIPSSIKETNFFLHDVQHISIEKYERYFKGNGEHAFEASPNYTKRHIDPHVARKMHSKLPGVKLIYLVRDPIERIRSHYVHNFCHGREKTSFSDAIRRSENYLLTSQYYYQIQIYLKFFSKDSILIIQSEELLTNTGRTLDRIYEFLKIIPDYDKQAILKQFHKSSNKRRSTSTEQFFRKRTNNTIFLKALKIQTKIFGQTVEKPVISQDDMHFLKENLWSDINKLRKFTGLQFESWQV